VLSAAGIEGWAVDKGNVTVGRGKSAICRRGSPVWRAMTLPGRKPPLSVETIEGAVRTTRHEKPWELPHWSIARWPGRLP
jgi:hypothetical protein